MIHIASCLQSINCLTQTTLTWFICRLFISCKNHVNRNKISYKNEYNSQTKNIKRITLHFCKITLVSLLIDCHLRERFLSFFFSSLTEIYLFYKFLLRTRLVFIDLPCIISICIYSKLRVPCSAEKYWGCIFIFSL